MAAALKTFQNDPISGLRTKARASIAHKAKATVYSMPQVARDGARSRARHVLRPEVRVEFFRFDKAYLDRLGAGDPETQLHFASYFGRFLRIRFRARRLSPDVIDDLVQDTLLRVIIKVHKGEVRQAECFGAFVNAVSDRVLLEHFRKASKNSHATDEPVEVPDKVLDLDGLLATQETVAHVRLVLAQLPEKDRRILRRLFFDEEDKDSICNEFGVKRDYLRVLVLRAKGKFRVLYK